MFVPVSTPCCHYPLSIFKWNTLPNSLFKTYFNIIFPSMSRFSERSTSILPCTSCTVQAHTLRCVTFVCNANNSHCGDINRLVSFLLRLRILLNSLPLQPPSVRLSYGDFWYVVLKTMQLTWLRRGNFRSTHGADETCILVHTLPLSTDRLP